MVSARNNLMCMRPGGLLFKIVRAARLSLTDPAFRAEAYARVSRPVGMFTHSNLTMMNRYPRLFEVVARHLEPIEGPRALSFGCSTGDELLSLRAYSPHAEIVGVDVNRANVAIARRKVKSDPRIIVKCADSLKSEESASFDAIMALSVFRSPRLISQRPEHCGGELPFEAFEAAISDFDRCLKPGGLLAIRNAMFRFSDTIVAPRYDVVCRLRESEQVPLRYGRDNRKLENPDYADVVFRKRSMRTGEANCLDAGSDPE